MLKDFSKFTYSIIKYSDLTTVNFSEINEDSPKTVRFSLDQNYFIISYEQTPSFILKGSLIPVKNLSHSEAVLLMETENWTPKEEEI